ncbi:MAG: hypothetical protein ACYC1Y_01615 [Minisyncoccota bacterium]
MSSELTDLLPSARKKAIFREYYSRLGVVAIVLAATLVLAAGVLLLPTYVFLSESANMKKTHLDNVKSTLSSSNEVELSARLTALSNEAADLKTLAARPSASGIIRAALAVARPGVTLSGITYTPVVGKNPGTLALSGVATTRNALRNYQLALQSAPFATAADLPVSAYAKDADIAFVITVTLAP